MTITSTLTDQAAETTVFPRREPNAATVAIGAQLTAAAAAAHEAVRAAGLDGGARRRAEKVARQIGAASRLIARGRFLEPGKVAELMPRMAASFAARKDWNVHSVDNESYWWREAIQQLHAWRGHTCCLMAATDR